MTTDSHLKFSPNSPAALGYRMPAEWEPHTSTWLSWPHNLNSWPDRFEPVPAVWAEFAQVLAQGEHVHILAGGEAVMADAVKWVGGKPNITLHDVPTNDAWMRDHGPTFLVGPAGSPASLVDWGYNAWGGKYPPFDLDDQVPAILSRLLGRRRFEPGIILEGGSIDGNGRGVVMTTEQCLLNPNRNPHLSRAEIEQFLADFLGFQKVLWLGDGIDGDDTDGHIDDLARFVNPTTIVTVVEDDPSDPNYEPLQDNLRRLRTMTDLDGRPFEVVSLPMPRPIDCDGQRMPASYANFYIANRSVVLPVFDDPADEQAVAVLTSVFPDRQVVPIRAVDLVWGLGAFHCISQQEPALPGAAG